MRDWLVHGEWCDVRLLCRGRVFSAHRTVLASVSAYLRCILVSHTELETPIYIVLPDFDLDAMSSVLYYVYNGEINVPIKSLHSFFEIINTLKIFIDQNSLDNVKDNISDCISKELLTRSDEVKSSITDGLSDDTVKLENKDTTAISKIVNKSQSRYSALQVFSSNQAEQSPQQRHTYVDMQMKDRVQKTLSLRDPLTEMCARNGKTNRPSRSSDVPDITNGRYLNLSSGEVMNGNDIFTNTVDPEIASINSNYTANAFNYERTMNFPKLQDFNHTKISSNVTQDVKLLSNLFLGTPAVDNDNNNKCNLNRKSNGLRPPPTLVPIKKHVNNSSNLLDLSKYIRENNKYMKARDDYASRNSLEKTFNDTKETETKTISINKNKVKSTLNQVLACPWIPRLPKSYRHFKTKKRLGTSDNTTQEKDLTINEQDIKPINDSNNNKNVDLPIVEPLVTELSSTTEEIVTTEDVIKTCNDDELSSNDDSSSDFKQTNKSRHTCTECGKSFSQLRNYKYHLSVHRGTKEFAATCPVCGKYFNDRGYLSSHMKIHKNRKEYQCPDCPKSFNQRVAYNMHIRIHTGVKPHVCSDCGKAFSRKMLLKQHQRTHSGERPYACTFCEKRFADRSNMTLHMRLHSGVKPFSCTLCSKSFTKKHHLKTHLNYHTGEKPYSCPRCSTAFSQSSNMRTHLKKCTAGSAGDDAS